MYYYAVYSPATRKETFGRAIWPDKSFQTSRGTCKWCEKVKDAGFCGDPRTAIWIWIGAIAEMRPIPLATASCAMDGEVIRDTFISTINRPAYADA